MNRQKAKEFLFDVISIFEKYNIKYYLDYGTLLGAIRENNFIKYDTDIDIGIFKKLWVDIILMRNLVKEFIKKKIKIQSMWDNGINGNLSLKRDNIDMGILYKVKNKKEYYKYGRLGKLTYPRKNLDKLEIINFLDRKVQVPSNPESYLEYLYGKDWRIPKRRFEYNHCNNIKDMKWKLWQKNNKNKKAMKIPFIISIYVDDNLIEEYLNEKNL